MQQAIAFVTIIGLSLMLFALLLPTDPPDWWTRR